jgi:hypothetical protein
VNGKFYTGIDGYMIAGPMFSQFMAQIAPAYGTEPFPEPPSNLLYGAPQYQPPVQNIPQPPNNPQPPSNQEPPSKPEPSSGTGGSGGNDSGKKGND